MNQYERLRAALADVVLTTVTPFDAEERVDLAQVRDVTQYVVDNGITSLIPGGNTGEFFSLTPGECAAITQATVEAAAGRAQVIAGIAYAPDTAIEMGHAAQDAGAVGVMLHYPIQTHMTDDGVFRYVTTIADALDIGVVLYKRGPRMSDAVISELVRHENVIGVKYADNNLNNFARLVEKRPDDVVWVCGTAERWVPFYWLAGARGFTSGLANFAPRESLNILDALRNGEWSRAMSLTRKVTPFETIRDRQNFGQNVPAVKAAMEMLGLSSGRVRAPLTPLPASEREQVATIITEWGYDVREEH